MNFFGRTEAVEKAFEEWKYAGNPERKEKSVRYSVDTSAFGGEKNEEDSVMEPLEIFYYILYPGEMPDSSLDELPRWNHDGGFWEGSDDIWEYCSDRRYQGKRRCSVPGVSSGKFQYVR